MSDEKMRADFEAWYAHQVGCDIRKLEECRWDGKGYRDPFAANAWFAWQASRAALVIELPEPMKANPGPLGECAYAQRCRSAIEAAGIKVRP